MGLAEQFGRVIYFREYNDRQTCVAACWNANGDGAHWTCVCGCKGDNHGTKSKPEGHVEVKPDLAVGHRVLRFRREYTVDEIERG